MPHTIAALTPEEHAELELFTDGAITEQMIADKIRNRTPLSKEILRDKIKDAEAQIKWNKGELEIATTVSKNDFHVRWHTRELEQLTKRKADLIAMLQAMAAQPLAAE